MFGGDALILGLVWLIKLAAFLGVVALGMAVFVAVVAWLIEPIAAFLGTQDLSQEELNHLSEDSPNEF